MTDSGIDAAAAGPGDEKRAPADYVEALEALLAAARGEDEALFSALLDDLTAMREQALFREVGQLTRQLHEALTSFQLDSRLADFLSDEFPDARQRLDHVIAVTEQSAHKTMDLVEEMLPRATGLSDRAQGLIDTSAAALTGKNGDTDAAGGGAREDFARHVDSEARALRAGLSEVIISQNYQDLAGQEIRKVIRLVTDVEETLINMIGAAGKSGMLTERRRAGEAAQVPEGEQRVDSQDEVDDLLSDLGF